jgi:hypothetical protein
MRFGIQLYRAKSVDDLIVLINDALLAQAGTVIAGAPA